MDMMSCPLYVLDRGQKRARRARRGTGAAHGGERDDVGTARPAGRVRSAGLYGLGGPCRQTAA